MWMMFVIRVMLFAGLWTTARKVNSAPPMDWEVTILGSLALVIASLPSVWMERFSKWALTEEKAGKK